MLAYNHEDIDKVIEAARSLRMLHEDVCVTGHVLYDSTERYYPYWPTFFLYNYFCFNTVFNINWVESLKKGVLTSHENANKKWPPEESQIKKLIDYCFSEGRFVQQFLPTFKNIVTVKCCPEGILLAMRAIIPDNRVKPELVSSFQDACDRILKKDSIDVVDFKTIYSYIYQVRCNIVHGSKSMQHMNEPYQKERIMVYSYFIIALLHMLFERLDYERCEGYDNNKSYLFLVRLNWAIEYKEDE